MAEIVAISGVASLAAKPPYLKARQGNTLLLGASTHAGKTIVFKIAEWDPTLHPRGYRGLFVDTPHKTAATNASIGDIIVSKGGKAFKVEKQTEKGVKVRPIDLDSGEIRSGYTVLGNGTRVAVFDSAKPVNSHSKIGELEPGTVVQHPKSLKRFEIGKHGKWTTVYPVDDNGIRLGKHTVLPKDIEVIVSAGKVTHHVQPKQVKEVAKSRFAKPELPPAPTTRTQALVTKYKLASKDVPFFANRQHKEEWLANHAPDSSPGATKRFVHDLEGVEAEYKADMAEYVKKLDLWDRGRVIANEGIETTTEKEVSDRWKQLADQWAQEHNWTGKQQQTTFQLTGKTLDRRFDEVQPQSIEQVVEILDGVHTGDWTSKFKKGVGQWFSNHGGDVLEKNHKASLVLPNEPSLREDTLRFTVEAIADTKVDPNDPNFQKLLRGEYQAEFEGGGALGYLEELWLQHHEALPDVAHEKAMKDAAKGIEETLDKHHKAKARHELTTKTRIQEAIRSRQGIKAVDVPKPVLPPVPDPALREQEQRDRWTKWANDIEAYAKANDLLGTRGKKLIKDKGSVAGWLHEALTPGSSFNSDGSAIGVSPKKDRIEGITGNLVRILAGNYHNEDAHENAKHAHRLQQLKVWSQGNDHYVVAPDSASGVLTHDLKVLGRKITSEQQRYSKDVTKANEDYARKVQLANAVQGDELLPGKLPVPPKRYPSGTGKNTVVVIDDLGESGVSQSYYDGVGEEPPKFGRRLRIKRVPAENIDAPGQLIGYETAVGRALTIARDQPAHEKVLRRTHMVTKDVKEQYKVGQYVYNQNGYIYKVKSVKKVEVPPGIQYLGGKERLSLEMEPLYEEAIPGVVKTGTQKHFQVYPEKPNAAIYDASSLTPITDSKVIADAKLRIQTAAKEAETSFYAGQAMEAGKVRPEQRIKDAKARGTYVIEEKQVRGAHPEKYIPELRNEWDLGQLYGVQTNTAVKTLSRLGYREITPRLLGNPKFINANGRRLQLVAQDGHVIHVDEQRTIYVGESTSGRDFHQQLSEVLKTGGTLDPLDPRLDSDLESRNSLTRMMLFDMAKGKQNGVAESIGKKANIQKVVTDKQYEERLAKKYPLEKYEKEVKSTPLTIRGRGATISLYGLNDDAAWDFESRQLEVPNSFSDQEAAALQVLIRGTGVAKILHAEKPDESIYKAAERLEKGEFDEAQIDKSIITGMLKETHTQLQAAREAKQVSNLKIAENLRKEAMKSEIAKLRKKENTVATAVQQSGALSFDLPVWDEIEMQPQNVEDIQQLVNGIGSRPIDVPVFFTGGVLEDGVAQFSGNKVYGRAVFAQDEQVVQRLVAAGAEKTANSYDLQKWFGYASSGTLHSGEMYLIGEEETITDATKMSNASDFMVQKLQDNGWGDMAQQVVEYQQQAQIQDHSYQQFVDSVKEGFSSVMKETGGQYNSLGFYNLVEQELIPNMQEQFSAHGKGRRIEYVPYEQAGDKSPKGGVTSGAPTSQRGQIRMFGYDTQEGIAKLKELGLAHDLEPEVPFTSIFRSDRRYGRVAPIHPDYLSGDAPLPKVKQTITHGVTGGAGTLDILRTGALLPITERVRHNLKVGGSSPNGDVRSGIDFGIFAKAGVSSWGTNKFYFKDNVYLRRDVITAPSDFGGSETRYNSYKNYANKLRKAVGEPAGSLYDPPLSPKARQQFIDTVSYTASNEFNPIPGVALEDIAKIYIPNQVEAEGARTVLHELIKEGFISEVPEIVTGIMPPAAKSMPDQPGTKVV